MADKFSDDNAKVTVSQLDSVVQGMAEKNEARYEKSANALKVVVSATQPATNNTIWFRPV